MLKNKGSCNIRKNNPMYQKKANRDTIYISVNGLLKEKIKKEIVSTKKFKSNIIFMKEKKKRN